MLEARGEAKSLKEIRLLVQDIDLDRNHKLSFLEWACAIFAKSWEELHSEVVVEVNIQETEAEKAARGRAEQQRELARQADDRAREVDAAKDEQARAGALALEEEARKQALVEAKIQADEDARKKKKADLEEMKKGSGAASRAKMFGMMAEGDQGMTVEEQVRLASKQRREEKAAKKRIVEEKAAAEAAAAEAAVAKAKADAERAVAEEEAAQEAELSRIKAEEEAAAEKQRIEDEEKRLYEEAIAEEARVEAARVAAEKAARAERRARLAAKAAAFQ
jgi:hypothetical protein